MLKFFKKIFTFAFRKNSKVKVLYTSTPPISGRSITYTKGFEPYNITVSEGVTWH